MKRFFVVFLLIAFSAQAQFWFGSVDSERINDLRISRVGDLQLKVNKGIFGDANVSWTLPAIFSSDVAANFAIQIRGMVDIIEGNPTAIQVAPNLGAGYQTGYTVNLELVGGPGCAILNGLRVITLTGLDTFTVPVDTTALACTNGVVRGVGGGIAMIYGSSTGQIVLEIPASTGVIAACDAGPCQVKQTLFPNFTGDNTVGWSVAPLATVPINAGIFGTVINVRPFLGSFNPSSTTAGSVYLRPYIIADDDANWSQTVSIGGYTISIGTNLIPLTPCPIGVSGTNANHYLYISDGVGAAEAVLITGGSCISGATAGTIQFTAVNAHTGAWRIRSATGGVQEALNSLANVGLGAGVCDGTVGIRRATFYAPVSDSACTNQYSAPIFQGLGEYGTVTRNIGFTAGHLFNQVNLNATYQNLTLGNAIAGAQTGAAIRCVDGSVQIRNVRIKGGEYGIKLENCQGSLDSVSYMQLLYDIKPVSAFWIGNNGVALSNNLSLSNLNVQSSDYNDANVVTSGIHIRGTDTVNVSNSILSSGDDGVLIDNGTANANNLNLSFSGVISIDNRQSGIQISGNTAIGSNIVFDGFILMGDSDGTINTTGRFVGLNLGCTTLTNIDNVSFLNGTIATYRLSGICHNQTTSNALLFSNLQIRSNGMGGNNYGFQFATGPVTGVTIEGNTIYSGIGNQTHGIFTSGVFDGVIEGNNLCGNTIAPVVFGGAMTGILASNKCLNDTIPFAGLPVNVPNGSQFHCSDCTFANPCAALGTGAIAKRLNGAWRCD